MASLFPLRTLRPSGSPLWTNGLLQLRRSWTQTQSLSSQTQENVSRSTNTNSTDLSWCIISCTFRWRTRPDPHVVSHSSVQSVKGESKHNSNKHTATKRKNKNAHRKKKKKVTWLTCALIRSAWTTGVKCSAPPCFYLINYTLLHCWWSRTRSRVCWLSSPCLLRSCGQIPRLRTRQR